MERVCRRWGVPDGDKLDNINGALRSLMDLQKGAAVLTWLEMPDYVLDVPEDPRSQEYVRKLRSLFATWKDVQNKDMHLLLLSVMSSLRIGGNDKQRTLKAIRMLDHPLMTVEAWLQRVAAFEASYIMNQEEIIATRMERQWEAIWEAIQD
jgi:hypothetical protein